MDTEHHWINSRRPGSLGALAQLRPILRVVGSRSHDMTPMPSTMNVLVTENGRRPARESTSPDRRSDSGTTLTEILIAIVLMGALIVPIMSAVLVTIKASSTNFDAAEVQTAVVNASDRVNRAPMSCDYKIYAQAAVQTQGWAPDRATVTHERFVPGSDPEQDGTWTPGACDSTDPTLELVQLVTVTITSPDGKLSRSIQVVKSNV